MNKQKNRNFSIIADPQTLGMVICFLITMVCIGILGIWGFLTGFLKVAHPTVGFIFAIVYIFSVILIGYITLPKVAQKVTFTVSGFECKSAFKKPIKIPFTDLTYIYHGYYTNGFQYNYIVFSSHPLDEYSLSMVNRLQPSDSFLKVRYTKRNYDGIMNLLPVSMKHDLQNVFQPK